MAYKQFEYYVPENVFVCLLNGELTKFGNVIRDTTGVIEHIKDIPLPARYIKNNAMRAMNMAKRNKYFAVGLGLAAAVGGVMFAAQKTQEMKQERGNVYDIKIPRCIYEFNNIFYIYLESIERGNLDINTVDSLIMLIDRIKDMTDSKSITLEYDSKQMERVLKFVKEYTRKMAEVNHAKLKNFDTITQSQLADFRKYLVLQRKIYEIAS